MKTKNRNVQVKNTQAYVLAIVAVIVIGALIIGGMNALGLVGGTAELTVTSTVGISLQIVTVNLGQLAQSGTNSTLDDNPQPFLIQNEGNVKLNVTINGTDLFSTTSNPTSNYQYFGNASSEGACWGNSTSGAVTTWTDVPTFNNPVMFIPFLNFTDSCDTAEVEIKVVVPSNEPIGSKSSTVTLLSSES